MTHDEASPDLLRHMHSQTTGSPTPTLRILIADDHSIVRKGLHFVLNGAGKGWAVSEASDGFEALDFLRRYPVDLVIADLSMPGLNGLDLIKRIRDEFSHVKVLVLSMHAEDQYALRAFKAGANGYVTKDRAASELMTAVEKVASGGVYVAPSLAEKLILQMNGTVETPRHAQLSDREIEVLRRLVAGQRLTDIADDLHLSVKTVSTHKSRIQEKLNLSSTAALVRYGMEIGIQPPNLWDEAGDLTDATGAPGTPGTSDL